MNIVDKFKKFFGMDRKISDILKEAKAKLISRPAGYRIYICHIINDVSNEKQSRYIRNWIHNLLDGSDSLETWLVVHYGITFINYSDDIWNQKMKQTRIRWIEWMIDHWEAVEAKEKIQKAVKRKEYLLSLFLRKK